MSLSKVAHRYAKALLATAQEAGIVEVVNEDIRYILKAIEATREFDTLLKSPVIQFWKKKQILEELFKDKISKLTLSFILLLADKRRENILSDIIKQWNNQYNELNNIQPAEISSAIELSDNIKERLVLKLNNIAGKKVLPDYRIDKSLKGGILIKISDWVFDASIRNQIELLYKQLSGN